MRILFALPGLHRTKRGAEVVFEAVAHHIAMRGDHEVSVAGSGEPIEDRAYRFHHIPSRPRERFERWPKVPFLRSEFMYEELTFAIRLLGHEGLRDADVTLTCGYPYANWALRRPRLTKKRPAHIFVTQNGDWPAQGGRGEPRFFGCDGLICTNPVYQRRNPHWRSALIPNGVDPERFRPGPSHRAEFGLPDDRPVVLMVSALQPNKRVLEAIRAIAAVPNAYLLVAGDGPLREEVDALGATCLPGRFARRLYPHDVMPRLFRSADLLLHASIGEPFGNIYIEGLSSGLPVVANDEAVTRWILGDHGYFVDVTSPAAISAAILAIIAESPRVSREGASWAHSRYSWKHVAAQYQAFIEDVVHARG
jgi:glycosyltransferase involved in cell wall biosynthesis